MIHGAFTRPKLRMALAASMIVLSILIFGLAHPYRRAASISVNSPARKYPLGPASASPTPTPQPDSSPEVLMALAHVSEQEGIPAEELIIVGEFPYESVLLGRAFQTVVLLDQSGHFFKMLVDIQSGQVEDEVAIKAAEEQVFGARYGKLQPALYEHLQTIQDEELVKVAIIAAAEPGKSLSEIQVAAFATLATGYSEAAAAMDRGNHPMDVEDRALSEQIEQEYTEILKAEVGMRIQPLVEALEGEGFTVRTVDGFPVVFVTLPKRSILEIVDRDDVSGISLVDEGLRHLNLDSAVPTNRAPLVWDRGIDGTGIEIGIEDPGRVDFDVEPPENERCPPPDGPDNNCFRNRGDEREGYLGVHFHATMLASCAASDHLELLGPQYRGMAPGVTINSAGIQEASDVGDIEALNWAIDVGSDVVVMAWTACTVSPDMQFIDYAYDHVARWRFTLPVVTAGNIAAGSPPCDQPHVESPGKAWNVLTVGAYDNQEDAFWGNDEMWADSKHENPTGGNEKPEVVAPGVAITGIALDGNLHTGTGTSPGSAQVGGLVALVMDRHSSLEYYPNAVKAIIMASATHNITGPTDIPWPPEDDLFDGAGGINALMADNVAQTRTFQLEQDKCAGSCWGHLNVSDSMLPPGGVLDRYFFASRGDLIRLVITWYSRADCPEPVEGSCHYDELRTDLNLSVWYDNGTGWALVDESVSSDHNFEMVEFRAQNSGEYRITVEKTSSIDDPTNEMGIALARQSDIFLPLVFKNFTSFIGSEAIRNGNFESGQEDWQDFSGNNYHIVCDWGNGSSDLCPGYGLDMYSGTWGGWLAGYDNAEDALWQTITVPTDFSSARLSFRRYVSTAEPGPSPNDYLHVRLRDSAGVLIGDPFILSLSDQSPHPGEWWEESIDLYPYLAGYQGEQVQIYFHAQSDGSHATSFLLDDVSLIFGTGEAPAPPTPPGGGYPPPPEATPLPSPTPLEGYPPPPTPSPTPTPSPLPTKPPVPDPLFGLNFPITTGPAREPQQRVAAAYNPQAHRYLVAWEQEDATIGTDTNVYARLVSDEGSVLLETIPVAVEPGPHVTPDVAYDPDADQFLVIWSGFHTTITSTGFLDVFGRFYDVVGQPIGDPFLISQRPGSELNPAVAYGGGSFLVTWDEGGADIYGRFVDPAGQVGPLLEVAVDPLANQQHPAVAYGDGAFLAVWDEGTQVFARSVDPAGAMGPPEAISDLIPDGAGVPEIAYGGNDTYLVAWNQAGYYITEAYARLVNGAGQAVSDPLLVGASPWSIPDPDVAFSGGQYLVVSHFAVGVNVSLIAVRMSPQGEVVGDPILVRGDPAQPYGPTVAAGPGGEFLPLWTEYADGQFWNIWAQRVAAGGDLPGPAVLVGSALLPPDQDTVAVAYGDDLYLAAWEEVPPEVSPGPYVDYDIQGRLVDPGGAFPGEVIPFITGAGNARMPALSYNPHANDFLLAYSTDDGAGGVPQVFLQRVGLEGPIGGSILVAASTFTQTHPDIASGGVLSDVLLIVWQEGQGANSRIHGRLLDGQGNPLGGSFLLAEENGGSFQRDAAVAADSGTGKFLVVWSGKYQGKEQVYLQTVDYTGQVDPAPPVGVAVPENGVKVGHPDIAGRDGLYVVAWERFAQGDQDIYLRRVRTTKELVGEDEAVLADEANQFLPALALAGPDEILVIWQGGRKGEIAGRRLRRTDLLLVGGRIDLSQAEGAQLRPAVAGDPQRRRYLSVWTDGRNVETSGLDVYGQLIRGF